MKQTPNSSSGPSRGRFHEAARGRGTGRPPIWIMRQAGRYLPQYQEIRKKHTFVEMCTDSDLALEISLQPYHEFGMDAVIVFYDILFLPEAMGAPLEYTEKGPVFHEPIRTADKVDALRTPGPGDGSAPLLETLGKLRAELPSDVALLGFAGAPFTLAAYLVEGDFRRSGDQIRRLMHADPDTLHNLLGRLTDATCLYVREQVEAGAEAVQLFDTWAGLLDRTHYDLFALPYQQKIFAELESLGVPSILYINGSHHILESMRTSGARIFSIDWRVSFEEARRRLGADVGLQGNLDPAALFGPVDRVRELTLEILDANAGDPSYIFNLGHGILPGTPVESLRTVVETVKSYSSGS